jgi:hypothetical protein
MVAFLLFIKMLISDTRSRWRISVLRLVFALAVLCVQVQSQAVNPPRMIQIKLEQYGWQRLPPPAQHEAWPTEARLMRVDSKGRVLIGYPVREGTDLATRGNPRLSFHIIRFAQEGKLDLSVSLPTDNLPNNEIWLDAQDHIFVVANESLQMLTGDDQTPTQQRTWKVVTSCSWFSQSCRIVQSPTRRRIFVIRCMGQKPNCQDPASTAYDTSSSEPQELRSCAWRGGSITERFGYLSGWERAYFCRRYPLCDSDGLQKLPLEDPVSAILNDDLFVTSGVKKRWEVGVVTATGKAKFRLQLPKHDSPALGISYVKGDSTGDRFAFVVDTLRGGSAALDIGSHLAGRRVVVYSSDSGAELSSLSIYPPVPHYGVALAIVPGFTFDLSPDGHSLAVLSEGILTTARIN